MYTYIIGDVQGCYVELQKLLELIHFDPKSDRLGFVGDLINRGPQSLETLRFIMQLQNPLIVLGNHDFHLITLASGLFENYTHHTLAEILAAPDKNQLIDFLRQQPLAYQDQELNFFMVHAGIPPQWSLQNALTYAEEVHQALLNPNYREFLIHLYGNEPNHWQENLRGFDRLRYITNAFTRMRFCDEKGDLDLENIGTKSVDPERFKPWFEWRHDHMDVFFGHWASLQGQSHRSKYYALDTGCVWGNQLTALRVEDKKLFSVNAIS